METAAAGNTETGAVGVADLAKDPGMEMVAVGLRGTGGVTGVVTDAAERTRALAMRDRCRRSRGRQSHPQDRPRLPHPRLRQPRPRPRQTPRLQHGQAPPARSRQTQPPDIVRGRGHTGPPTCITVAELPIPLRTAPQRRRERRRYSMRAVL
jgi:hypothetical protein